MLDPPTTVTPDFIAPIISRCETAARLKKTPSINPMIDMPVLAAFEISPRTAGGQQLIL
jgi:hypothetical protein